MSRTDFSKALVELLAAKGRNQSDLARALGLTPSAISYWTTAKSEPEPELVFRAEAALGVPLGTLSRHLGYVPVGSPVSVIAALEADDKLTPSERNALSTAYLLLVEHRGES